MLKLSFRLRRRRRRRGRLPIPQLVALQVHQLRGPRRSLIAAVRPISRSTVEAAIVVVVALRETLRTLCAWLGMMEEQAQQEGTAEDVQEEKVVAR